MTCPHDAVLQELERLLVEDGTPLARLDDEIAERLALADRDVGGYRLVRDALNGTSDTSLTLDGLADDAPLAVLRAAAVLDRIAQLATAIVRSSTTAHPDPQLAARHAAWVLGAVHQLRQHLRDLRSNEASDAR